MAIRAPSELIRLLVVAHSQDFSWPLANCDRFLWFMLLVSARFSGHNFKWMLSVSACDGEIITNWILVTLVILESK